MQNILKESTVTNIKPNTQNLSDKAYKLSAQSVSIIQNRGGGDCLFISIADAINYYNFHNQNNRILSGIYGTLNNAYTPLYLRSLVYDFLYDLLQNDRSRFILITESGNINADNLNRIFKETIQQIQQNQENISNEEYLNLARSIYTSHDNFMVENVITIPIDIDDYLSPFKIIRSISKLNDYILSSDYWGNETTVLALSVKLKLSIVFIGKIKNNSGNDIYSITNNNFDNSSWTKYLFIYDSDGHFELITFTYNKIVTKMNNNISYNKVAIKKVIFNRNELPPIYILFLIYGSVYSVIEKQLRYKFTFNVDMMQIIDNIINNELMTNQSFENASYYYNLFKYYFPYSKIEQPINDLNIQSGGLNNINPKYLYLKQYPAERLMKKENDNSKISYYITIDMELQPGKSITPDELKKIKCRQKWNAVRKAYARFVGKPYIIPPVYQNATVKNREENKTNKTIVNKSNNNNDNNNTRNYRQNINKREFNKNFTIKKK